MLTQRFIIQSGADHLASAIGLDNAQHVAKALGARFAPMPDSQWVEQESRTFFALGDSENYQYFPVWVRDDLARIRNYENRFALLKRESESTPWRVSYVARPEAPQGKRRNVIDLTRYLVKYYDLTSDKARDMSRRVMGEGVEFHTCQEAATFQEIYETCQVEYSCMRGPDVRHEGYHPSVVYAAGDIGIAWLRDTDADEIVGRAIYNLKSKRFPRVYGTTRGAELIRATLEAQGYTQDDGALLGCRLNKIEIGDDFLMPYLDPAQSGNQTVNDAGNYWRVARHGEYDCTETNGLLSVGDRFTCDHCGDRMNEDECNHVNGDMWCESCYGSHAFYCEYYNESYPDSEGAVTVNTRRGNEQTWCQDAADNNAFFCEYAQEWFDSRYFTEIEVTTRNGTKTACEEESSDRFFQCEETAACYDSGHFTQIEVEGATWCKEETETVYCAICQSYYPATARSLDVCSDGLACPLDGPRVALAWAASIVGFVA
jgi:hypothetical protein